jgi:hypothetical protein
VPAQCQRSAARASSTCPILNGGVAKADARAIQRREYFQQVVQQYKKHTEGCFGIR